MKVETFTFLKHKIYLFSFSILILSGIFSSMPAYSQVDFYYGINKSGFRFGLGGGVTKLQSNWSSSPMGYLGLISLDYDFNQYSSVGFEGQFGTLKGVDEANKFYYKQTSVLYGTGNINFKVAVGQFSDYVSRNAFQDAIKRIYIGLGGGLIYSNVTLTPHTDGKGLSSPNVPGIAVAKTITPLKQMSNGTFTGNSTFTAVPLSLGTNIALRNVLGSDKLDLNPNLEYTFVMSPIFDGYQPNSVPAGANTGIKINGNQAYFMASIKLRYKF